VRREIDRCAGILVPLFSLRTADDFGRGDFSGLVPMGALALAMGHRLIQLLPLDELASGETSPYNALSVFALDPVYIAAALLPGISAADRDAARARLRNGDLPVDLAKLRTLKGRLLAQSYHYYKRAKTDRLRNEYEEFIEQHRGWLDDYALYRALKDRFAGAGWESWPPALRCHDHTALSAAGRELAEEVAIFRYGQFIAHRQWSEVRARLQRMGVLIGGDLAFSPCRESVEVWANQGLFHLNR